jgi:hypothetical protein
MLIDGCTVGGVPFTGRGAAGLGAFAREIEKKKSGRLRTGVRYSGRRRCCRCRCSLAVCRLPWRLRRADFRSLLFIYDERKHAERICKFCTRDRPPANIDDD